MGEAGSGARHERSPREPERLAEGGHEQDHQRYCDDPPERDHGQRIGTCLEG